MNERYYGPAIRVRQEPAATGGTDLIVEERRTLGKVNPGTSGPVWPFPTYQWFEKRRFNDMSNGMAHTECDQYAASLRKTLMENEK
jgi:hypothetical protein